MSLRDQLKRAVASCASIGTQHATFEADNATGSATPAQQPPANPHGIRKVGATDSATPAQPVAKNDATFTPSEVAGCATVAPVASELTAEREMRKLLAAAMRACDHYNDGHAAREQMVKDCLDTPPELRGELREHFINTYRKERS